VNQQKKFSLPDNYKLCDICGYKKGRTTNSPPSPPPSPTVAVVGSGMDENQDMGKTSRIRNTGFSLNWIIINPILL
jgi:hypothetical protein